MRYNSGSPVDLNSPRRSQIWPPAEPESLDTTNSRMTVKAKSESGKKTKVFTKFWRIVTGHRNYTPSEPDDQHNPEKLEKLDDDMPLAPPPPLSYLVERGSPDMAPTGGRQNSAPSISSTPPKFGYASPGMSPPTAPSSALPSPVSSRPPGPGMDHVEIRFAPNGRFDDAEDIHVDGLPKVIEPTKILQPATSVPDMRQVGVRSTSPPPPLPPLGPHHLQAFATTREKSLPPIPPNEEPASPRPSHRPRTVYTYDPRPLPPGTGPAHDFLPPNAPFRSNDVRRQSFGGLSSRPNLPSQTLYMNGNSATYDPRRSFSPRYDEFGSSRRSLGRIDMMHESLHPLPRSSQPLSKDTKWKSKFGLSSLLGRKNHNKSQDLSHEKSAYLFPTTTDSQDEWCVNYAASNSRLSGLSMAPPGQYNPRISIASRKALEELVSQDSEFVAYRYPSHDQRLDLFR
jgi:hypothetical protein